MKRRTRVPLSVKRSLRKLGEYINFARRRKRITIQIMANRADISRTTVQKIEKGDLTVAIGSYAAVLFVLGMIHELGDFMDSARDSVGRVLQDYELPKRIRMPKKKQKMKMK